MGCTLVSGKVEECHRRIRDVINIFHYLLHTLRHQRYNMMPYVGEEYQTWRDRVTNIEIHLLRQLGFHVQPRQPIGLLANYLNALEVANDPRISQRAINYVNDGMRGLVAVCQQPNVIACAAIHLAGEDANLALPAEPKWHLVFDVDEAQLNQACQLIKAVYSLDVTKVLALPLDADELRRFKALRGLQVSPTDGTAAVEGPIEGAVPRPHQRSREPRDGRRDDWRDEREERKRREEQEGRGEHHHRDRGREREQDRHRSHSRGTSYHSRHSSRSRSRHRHRPHSGERSHHYRSGSQEENRTRDRYR